MKRMTTAALAVLALAATAVPAHADATVKDGRVGLSVKGHGLSVRRAGGWIDSPGIGVRARLYTVHQGERRTFTRWKDTTPIIHGAVRVASVEWELGRRFTSGTRLCIKKV
ncbi:hypothetical protein [Streptomyces sp. NBC_00696]|uniref:hypothetical protein n=1 Tax=Streptomyces sp. NBC_00696 TaxID=2903672 RepID=UPI002E30DFC7|nr:hypothetical protein [Streptomyces sp. NBC_00696]